ncbi:hypothetical protein RHGRI_024235 [Rhododendron griersonianum]|uniref:Uncharacterized protein n=1 Tax=Rhododendron griersonianum TaxID=479676 RepID=A0AAV6J8T4_9ERIC|nr:hypothetical protein RHGRI_024235 [Rhododendron griersonianum]
MHGGDDIRGVEERLRLGRHQHEQAHGRNRRPVYDSDDGEPHEEVAREALDRAADLDHPRPDGEAGSAPADGDGGVEEAGEYAGVGADVLEDGDDVEGGLVVALAGLEHGGVDSEGVGCAAAALDPYARHRGDPFAALHLLIFPLASVWGYSYVLALYTLYVCFFFF